MSTNSQKQDLKKLNKSKNIDNTKNPQKSQFLELELDELELVAGGFGAPSSE